MSRNLSANFWRAARMNETAEDVHLLLTIYHKSLITPIYVVSDSVSLTSNGIVYEAFPFTFVIPQEDDSVPRGRLRFQNIDRAIGMQILAIKDALRAKVAVVLRSAPDVEEFSYKYLYIRNCRGNAQAIEAELGSKNFSTLIYPNVRASKTNFPGLFVP